MSADTTVTEEDISQAGAKLVRYGRAMAADRLAVGSAGNLSIRLGDTVVMTPLADAASAALDGRYAALLQNHGAVAYGASIDEAYDRALLLEWLAEVYWRARLAGSPRILSDAELDAVREAARQHRYRSGGA